MSWSVLQSFSISHALKNQKTKKPLFLSLSGQSNVAFCGMEKHTHCLIILKIPVTYKYFNISITHRNIEQVAAMLSGVDVVRRAL